ncbi:hypothetical protein EDD18DRAFT_1104590 [Armillaria luteobubalina]|uniref:Uncharacterized protein n=1 Tax=Armillaria luteobubalina TaxID=153913 RepID=A0AA39Q7P9_9AGAR|nr:hypothetical protein EDD18DRAFT_1104590 [Armillaria luteobubalina]
MTTFFKAEDDTKTRSPPPSGGNGEPFVEDDASGPSNHSLRQKASLIVTSNTNSRQNSPLHPPSDNDEPFLGQTGEDDTPSSHGSRQVSPQPAAIGTVPAVRYRKPRGQPDRPRSGGYSIKGTLINEHGWTPYQFKSVLERMAVLAKSMIDANQHYRDNNTRQPDAVKRLCDQVGN